MSVVTCCGASACESQFDRKRAARELRDYRAHGPTNATTRAMIHLLRRAGVDGGTLLDIGAGIGAIQYDLLEAGAREVTAVDGAPPHPQGGRAGAGRRGWEAAPHVAPWGVVEPPPPAAAGPAAWSGPGG